ncbi:similar to Saccharomyces cerevisiae YML097C VPS9 guanine nucleotide exchange factor involved in vesicle-mediated vacuolar protein transport [Maudiozyma saulgeensis]|uniref:Similar to Saccharomyces cerevisiae YML097C VPS9 guanine nucleotide exchange factor involved in vesicle-mediated vacuolar protein transport n=1 Tax=Maudiozyma saulgeensis TaxID=1789683 RepID=A0A1X7R476_9SACH|nr:similar to Saccharomyces cerevisiae YML097C VPS9 guanine nucleotide exchange factor involved in vesicle-mediated vacuolar protein transport [Kazachstania saulgeensis]
MSDLLREFDPLSQGSSNPQISKPSATSDDNESITSEPKQTNNKKSDEEHQEELFFDFQMFINDFKNPTAEPLVKYTRSFLNNFVSQRALWTASEQRKLINDFKLFIYDKFSQFKPFSELDNAKLRNAQEGIEKLIMGKLYPLCFSPELIQKIDIDKLDEEHRNDILEDGFLQEKIDEYNFIELDNLDVTNKISLKLSKFLKLAGKELNKINQYKAPRDKIVCILNACKIIFSILRHFKLDQDGADSFIPLLIYVIIHGNVSHVISNIKFIERFRFENFLKSEDQYYLSSLQGATNFITNLNRKDLTIHDEEAFENAYNSNQERLQKQHEEFEADSKLKGSVTTANKNNINANGTQEVIIKPDYNNNPIDEIASSMVSMFNDFFIGQPSLTTKPEPQAKENIAKNSRNARTQSNSINENITDDKQMRKVVKRMEQQERQETLESLYEMFPDLPKELVEDICIAKKFRTGVCVDTLLNLYE